MVNWSDLEANDNSGQNPIVACSVESGSQFGIGEIEVVCQAIDSAGNRATCAFTVKIAGKPIRLFSNMLNISNVSGGVLHLSFEQLKLFKFLSYWL